MTTLNLVVAASADDANELTTGAVSLTTAGVVSDHVDEWIGFRFDNVTIPAGSTINSAVLSVLVSGSTLDEPNHTFDFEAADDAAQFTTGTNDISGRTYTGNSVNWDSADLGADGSTFFSPPDMTTALQAVIDRAGWASGQAVVVACRQTAPSASTRDLGVIMWDLDSTNPSTTAAKLDIDYTAPSGGSFTPRLALMGVG